jgi:hypothetical protein
MKIMFLNHQSKREGSPEYHARIAAMMNSYASPGTTVADECRTNAADNHGDILLF